MSRDDFDSRTIYHLENLLLDYLQTCTDSQMVEDETGPHLKLSEKGALHLHLLVDLFDQYRFKGQRFILTPCKALIGIYGPDGLAVLNDPSDLIFEGYISYPDLCQFFFDTFEAEEVKKIKDLDDLYLCLIHKLLEMEDYYEGKDYLDQIEQGKDMEEVFQKRFMESVDDQLDFVSQITEDIINHQRHEDCQKCFAFKFENVLVEEDVDDQEILY